MWRFRKHRKLLNRLESNIPQAYRLDSCFGLAKLRFLISEANKPPTSRDPFEFWLIWDQISQLLFVLKGVISKSSVRQESLPLDPISAPQETPTFLNIYSRLRPINQSI